ncbi:MAG TPA: AsmA-like C-terminal region-containing protein [Steroidobacteraceae bacterium]
MRPARSHTHLLALGLGGSALLVVVALLGYALIAARIPQHRAALEQLIRHETGLEVSFSGLSVRWGWYGPEAVFHDIAVGDVRPGPSLHAPELIVALDAWRMARSGRFEAGRITFVNPDIDLSTARATGPAAPGSPQDSALDAAAKLLARWRGDRVDLAGGTMRLPAGESAPPLIVSLRHAQLRRRVADWGLEVQALLPDTLGADMQLHASVHGDMAQPRSLQGSVRFRGERLVFAGWHGVLGARALAAYLPGGGTGNVDLNMQLAGGAPVALNGTVRAESLEWLPRSAGAVALRLPRLRAEWRSARRDLDWVVAVSNLDVGAAEPLSSQVLLAGDGTARGLVRAVPLALAADIARWHDPDLPFSQLALGGTVRELDFAWDGKRAPGMRLHALAQVESLTLASATHDLSLSGLGAWVSGNDTRMLVELGARSAQLLSSRAPPVRLDGLSVAAHLLVGADGERWRAQTQDLEIRGEAMRLAVHGMVAAGAPQDSGRVDAHVDLAETDAVMLASLLGARTGSAFGIEAGRISAGRIASGTLELRGPLYVDPALPRAPGEFHGALELRAVSLAGDETWPSVQDLSAHLDWRAERVEAAISDARSGSFRLSKARLQWDPRPHGAVHFTGLLAGEAQEALQWLRDRPDLGRYAPTVQGVDLRGAMLLDVDVRLAAQRTAAPKVRVTAVLDGTQLSAVAGIPPILLAHGTLAFADGRLQRSSLTGQWLGGPVSLSVAERRERGASTLALAARGSLDARQALAAVAANDADPVLTGNAEWTAQLSIPAPAEHGSGRWNLRADSALVGVASGLPEPFAKPAEASVPLHLELSGADSNAQLRVAFGERLRALLALTRSADAWRIERGGLRLGAVAAELPADAVFSVQGRIARLDLPRYLALVRAGAAGAALPVLQSDVSAGELLLGGHTYPEVRILARGARRGGEVELQSALLSGSLRWPEGADAQPARLELARFDAAQVSELMQGGALAAALAPVTRLAVEDLRWQGRSLGRLSALVTRQAEEVAFSEVRLTGASEDARGSAGCHGSTCNVTFSLDSTDAQSTLATYGLRPDVEARRANLSGELSWRRDDASPLASLDGSLHMLITDGSTRLPARDAGAPFPLFVVPALLAGIAPEHDPAPTVHFARLAASYEVREGVASTADLHLDGDAEMLARARLGLVAGDYDGEAFVLRGEARLPKALRGLGPTPKVAAAWLALRDWLGGGAGERGRVELRLRGTWADPIVTTQ